MPSPKRPPASVSFTIQIAALVTVLAGLANGLFDSDIDTIGNWLLALGLGLGAGVLTFVTSRL